MIFLKAKEIIFQRLHLGIQVVLAQGQLVQDPAQASDVALHQLVKSQFRIVPFITGERESQPMLTLLDTAES